MLKHMLAFTSYEEALSGLREVGLNFQLKEGQTPESLTEEEAKGVLISAVEGLKSMAEFKRAEKGVKLL